MKAGVWPVVVMVLSTVGCASVSPWQRTAPASDVPANWSHVPTGDTVQAEPMAPVSTMAPTFSTVPWWQRFNDPLLANLIAQAMRANTSVNGALAALNQSRALRDASAAALWPVLSGAASAQRNHSAGRTSNLFRAGLDASWELDFFGGRRSALNASEALVRASEASLGDVQVSIAAELALDYITLRALQARLLIANENLASQQETLQITQWRLQAGLVTSLDAEQARAAAEQTSALIPALQTGLEQSSHAVAVLAGQPPASMLSRLQVPGLVPQAAGDTALSMPAETLRQRPDVRAAEQQVSAASAQIDQAEAARLPGFSIGGSLGLSAATLSALTHGASVVSDLLGSITVPLFDGGALRAQVRAQQAAYEQATQTYRAAVLLALKDVEDALVALLGDGLKLTHLLNAADAATSAATMARQQYSSGLVDFQSVLETQRTQLATQDSLASARADVASDQVRLYKALGGGWRADDAPQVALTTAP
jgi:multidrug efflux system outer membrane protein